MRRQPFVHVLQEHRAGLAQIAATQTASEQAKLASQRAIAAATLFVELPLSMRLGWLCFGHKWLVKRLNRV
jgi:hypothetical protein